MDQLLLAEVLTSDSDEIADLKANVTILDNFIDLARQIEELPNISKRFYEESRSLFQATSTDSDITSLETLLAKFFGPPVKSAGKPLPRKLRKSSSVNYLGGIHREQSLFLLNLKTGEFYGALWPWRRNKAKIEIHLGYCSDWITDNDYLQIETLFKRSLSHSTFEQMDTNVGGQIHGIGLPSFLQMAEMERSTFTLKISTGSRTGRLFISKGALIAAQTDELTGREAAYSIISWDDATIEIAPAEESRTDEIKQPLMHVLMESLKLKDEITSDLDLPPDQPPPKKKTSQAKRIVRLQRAPVPKQPKKKARAFTLAAIVIGGLAVAAALYVVNIQLTNNSPSEDSYEKLVLQVEEEPSLEKKIILLQDYLQKNSRSEHQSEIQKKIDAVRNTIEDRDFEQVTLGISNLEINDGYEPKAIAMYSDFLEKYPHSRYTEQINKAIGKIKTLVDQYYYEELKRAARLDLGERLKTYRKYLSQFPEGKYRQDVEILIEEMGRQYLAFLKSESRECEQNKRWEPCIERCNAFIASFEGLPLSQEAGLLKSQMVDKRDLIELQQAAEAVGTDYQKAFQTYTNYLQSHPQTSQRAVIEQEIDRLEKQVAGQKQWTAVLRYATDPQKGMFERIQRVDRYLQRNIGGPYAAEAQNLINSLESERRAMLQQRQMEAKQKEALERIQREREQQARRQERIKMLSAGLERQLSQMQRFHSNGDGTLTDMTTGLTWSLLDAYQELGGCVTYENARKFVQNLRYGGHTDWRLPTASELAALYKQEPFYPASGAEWYWSSESYAKGYHTVADVVTAKPETVFQREHRALNACGSVRAVRP